MALHDTVSTQNEYKYCADKNIKCKEVTNTCTDIKICTKIKPISRGAFGQVYLCTADDKVVKVVKNSEDIKGEIDYVKYDTLKEGEKYKHVAEIFLPVTENENKLNCGSIKYIVMEKVITLDKYVDLMNKTIKDDDINLFNAKFLLIRKLIEALRFLHMRIGYCHNDLKPQNIGIKKIVDNGKSFWMIKFIDMGASTHITSENRDKMYKFAEADRLYQQTILFSCPLLLEYIQHDYYRDMWAMGCIVYNIVCGEYMIITDLEPQIYKVLMNMDMDSLAYMLCIDDEDPDLKKPSMKQCISGAMSNSREEFKKVMDIWYKEKDIPLKKISFIKSTIFDFMYKSVVQCYESTDMYQKLKTQKTQKGGANPNAKPTDETLKTEAKPTDEEFKTGGKPTDEKFEIMLQRKKYTQLKDLQDSIKLQELQDSRDVDMLRNLVYLKINSTKKIDGTPSK